MTRSLGRSGLASLAVSITFFCGRYGNDPVNVKGLAAALSADSLLIGGLAGAEWCAGALSPVGGKRKDVIVFTPSSSDSSKSSLVLRCLFSRPCVARAGSAATVGGVGNGRATGGAAD